VRGDVIRGINGKKIDSPDELQTIISATEPKKVITLQIIRDKEEMNISLITGETPPEEKLAELGRAAAPAEETAAQWMGTKVTGLNSALAQRFNFSENEKGCVIVDVSQGSTAESVGIIQGDLIRSVNQTPISGVREFEAVTSRPKLSQEVVLDVDRQGTLLYLSFSERQ